MYKNKKNLRGVTLIELLIVIAIIGIVSSVTFVSLSIGRQQKQVDGAAKQVMSVVRKAQNYALTGTQSVTNTQPCRFDVNWGATGYSVVYRYKDASGACNTTSTIESYSLIDGVSFSNTGSVTFDLPHAAVNANRTLSLTKGGQSYSVCVYQNGRIDEVRGTTCP